MSSSNEPSAEPQVMKNATVVDLDLLGKNWCSLKVSHATGNETVKVFNVDGTEVEHTTEREWDVTINVHRWTRIVAVAAAVYFVFEAGVAAVAPRVLPWIGKTIPALAP